MAKVRVTKDIGTGALLGKDVLVFINYGENASYEEPCWTMIGGQRTASMSDTAAEIDVTNKTSGGYGDFEAGIKTNELTVELVAYTSDKGYQQFREAYHAGEAIDVLRWHKSGYTDRNWYVITEFSDETPHDDAVTISAKLKGKGAPKYYYNMEDPRMSFRVGTAKIGHAKVAESFVG